MRAVHLTLMVFCNVLLAAVVIHFTSLAAALPLSLEHHKAAAPVPVVVAKIAEQPQKQPIHPPKESLEQKSVLPIIEQQQQTKDAPVQQAPLKGSPAAAVAEPAKPKLDELSARSVAVKPVEQPQQQPIVAPVEPQKNAPAAHAPSISHSKAVEQPAAAAAVAVPKVQPIQEVAPVLTERKALEQIAEKPETEIKQDVKQQEQIAVPKMASLPVEPIKVAEEKPKVEEPIIVGKAPTSPLANQQTELVQPLAVKEAKPAPVVPQPAALVAADPVEPPQVIVPLLAIVPPVPVAAPVIAPVPAPVPASVVEQPTPVVKQEAAPSALAMKQPEVQPQVAAPVVEQQSLAAAPTESKVAKVPVVMGGLGPLHLLASTLCSYQVDKLVADEHLNQLYARRASVRRSLFEFMSLKFTNLEKLSSRLGYGLQVVPVKSPEDNKAPGLLPSHGWPVVGKCTAHDLKLMGEAAWCECNPESDQGCSKPQEDAGLAQEKPVQSGVQPESPKVSLEPQGAITSNQHRVVSARSLDLPVAFLPSPEESSVISKILHVGDIKDAPTVESSIYNLNLTQHQLATLEAQATSTQECRRNALRYTKALFNHLAEDQKSVSESWPKLYALISTDDCARKRMIDIVNALSSFRTDTTSIRRDNLEFAFAMDDLRSKVLESEVNVPLTFDRHFIEVEQFLQQSVRLMLANIQPKRAKLTSMRYRSLMYGTSQSSDEQCIDLHQRLLSRNYPLDCNPTQFGQLPDVLRMTASSLELWSIEKELSQQTSKMGQQKVNDDVNECIANLVSS